MPFPQAVKQDALIRSKRSCCLCNEFTGLFTDVHHIIQEADGGPNLIDNAIVLCLRCHGEVGHYNPRHPIGNKYSPDEIKSHRNAWWEWCRANPNSPPPKHPILVSPTKIEVLSGYQRNRSVFKVHNTTSKFFYDVWIQISLGLNGINRKQVNVEEAQSTVRELSFLEEGDSIPIGSAGTDELGKPAIWVIIHEMMPNESKEYAIEVGKEVSLKISSNVTAYVSTLSFEHEPSTVITHANERRTIRWTNKGYMADELKLKFTGKVPPHIDDLAGCLIDRRSIESIKINTARTEYVKPVEDRSEENVHKLGNLLLKELWPKLANAKANFLDLWNNALLPAEAGTNVHTETIATMSNSDRTVVVDVEFTVSRQLYLVPKFPPLPSSSVTNYEDFCRDAYKVEIEDVPSGTHSFVYRVEYEKPIPEPEDSRRPHFRI